jgi:lipid-A-disaccharide synthase
MMTILPFEKELYDNFGVDCRYVGHPALDYLTAYELDNDFMQRMQAGGNCVVGLLPGSRLQEVHRTFDIICGAASHIRKAIPEAQFHVAAVAAEHRAAIREVLEHRGVRAEAHVGKTQEIMKASRVCLVCSGTATLETAFRRTPMVIVYRTSSWHRFIVPFFLNVKHIGLVNIVGGGEVAPEFLKFDDNPTPVADAALKLLRAGEEWQACRDRIDAAMATLGPPGSFDRAAAAVLEMVGR